ncbi:MAG: hypothetical protein IJ996_03710 [Clostridia bacterium]|nr:hypothetical protein [Clostridia bacterium]
MGLPWQTANPTPVYTAKADSANNMDTSFVIDDLGVDFVSQYKPQAGAKPALQSFMEYMYTDKEETRGKYALYVYIYNPSQTEYSNVVGDSVLNMAVEYNDAGDPVSYTNLPLKNCGYTMGQYDKLFYKFRVLGLEQVLANAVTSEENLGFRRYDLATIQLLAKGAKYPSDYEIAKTFTYSGYGKGCGAGAEEESTLVYKNADMDVLSLTVHPTTYRPAGNNGKSEYTQDSLHSVWFSVPNEYIDKYGEMYAVHATWLDAVLKPALVTGNQDAYNAIKQYLGKDIGEHCEDLDYAYLGGMNWTTVGQITADCKLSYNANSDMTFVPVLDWGQGFCSSDNMLSCLYLLFNAGSGEDSADEFSVTSEMLKQESIDSVLKYGGPLVLNRYSSMIFSSVAEEKQDVNLTPKDEFSLEERVLEKSYWQELYRKEGDLVSSTTFSGIKAVYRVTDNDLLGTTKEVSDRLYIAEYDVPNLRADFSTAQSNNETIYIFRYQVSDYNSYEAVLFEKDTFLGINEWDEVDTNAYFFTNTVNLDFEIIDVTFKKDERLTVIPVVMSPIDVFPASTPPLDTESDKDKAWWEKINWTLILVVVALVLLFPLYKPFLKVIIDGLVWLITLPLKLLSKLFSRIFNSKK